MEVVVMVKLFDKYEFPEGLYYSKDHLWLKIEGDLVRVGVTDLAQQAAGPIVYVRLMPKGKVVEAGKPIGTIETGKWVGPLKSPVSGTIVELNEALKSQPKLLNEDPYGKGWLALIKPSKLEDELKGLFSKVEDMIPWLQEE
ncbi:MAG: glycine cleavage system protein H, partial [Nitrososphaerota archaeon]